MSRNPNRTAISSEKLNRRITVQRKGTDAAGRPVNAWIDVVTLFAARRPVNGREFNIPTAVNNELTVQYDIRYRPGITPDMRLVESGRIYNITAVLDDVFGDRTETHIAVKEVRDG